MTGFRHDLGESLRTRPFACGLILLAVAVGTASACLLMATLGGLQARVGAVLESFGSGTVLLTPTRQDRRDPPPTRDLLAQLEAVQPGLAVTGLRVHSLPDPSRGLTVQVLAANPDLPRILDLPLRDGRWLDALDLDRAQPHAVISAALADAWSLRVGDALTDPRLSVRVVGVVDRALLNPANPALPQGAAHWIWIPDTLPVGGMAGPDALGRHDHVLAGAGENASALAQALADRDTAWTAITAEALVKGQRSLMRTLRVVYGSVVGLCLLLGGVALSSLLLMSTRQRRQEIGFRRALGATPGDIFALFLAEGLLLTSLGGGAGTAVGLLLIRVAPASPDTLPLAATPATAGLPLLLALVFGFLFTWHPARTAARLPPADALRLDA